MTQFDILVKSSIPPCQILARTAPEFTECNSKSASTRAFFFFFYITNWTLGWLRMLQNGFFLNQKKYFRKFNTAPLLNKLLQASVQIGKQEPKLLDFPVFHRNTD